MPGRRYDVVRSGRNKEGYWRKETTYYMEVPLDNNDTYVLTQWGDRFDTLSFQYYGTPHYWWYIASANNMKFNNIPDGTTIRIPANLDYADVKKII
tara:strand:+ start:83 stop:370 length:288 start_codon:yes stop_codon:yes gene_type:complete